MPALLHLIATARFTMDASAPSPPGGRVPPFSESGAPPDLASRTPPPPSCSRTSIVSLHPAAELVEQPGNTIRFLAVNAVEKAKSGHPGLPVGCALLGHVLYDENPRNHAWFDRDRFVLFVGHGCMLQYALLYLAGYQGVSMDDLKAFSGSGEAELLVIQKILVEMSLLSRASARGCERSATFTPGSTGGGCEGAATFTPEQHQLSVRWPQHTPAKFEGCSPSHHFSPPCLCISWTRKKER